MTASLLTGAPVSARLGVAVGLASAVAAALGTRVRPATSRRAYVDSTAEET